MAEDGQEKEQIRVVDRRRFTNEGEPAHTESASSAQAQDRVDAAARPVSEEAAIHASGGAKKAEEQSIDFSSFIVSLATQCLMMLGEMPNPETKMQSMNIGAAKQTIEILALLETKTKGNLTADENKMLGEILSALRLAFAKKVSK